MRRITIFSLLLIFAFGLLSCSGDNKNSLLDNQNNSSNNNANQTFDNNTNNNANDTFDNNTNKTTEYEIIEIEAATELVCSSLATPDGYSAFKINAGTKDAPGYAVSCSLLLTDEDEGILWDAQNVTFTIDEKKYPSSNNDIYIDINWTNDNQFVSEAEHSFKSDKPEGPHKIEIDFDYNGEKKHYETTVSPTYLSLAPQGSFPYSVYNGLFEDYGLSDKNIPILAYNYNGSKNFDPNKIYAFIRIQGDSTAPNYACQDINGKKACPRDIIFQTCAGDSPSCYVTFRGDYLANDYDYKRFRNDSNFKIEIPVYKSYNITQYFKEDRGFQFDDGKKMNFPFYFGDPNLVLPASASTSLYYLAIQNESHTFFMGTANFGRIGNVPLKANMASRKTGENIALFTITWLTYDKSYKVKVDFDGWKKLEKSN